MSMDWIAHLSLLSGPLPEVLAVGAGAALTGSVVRARRRWVRDFALTAAATMGVVLAVGELTGIEHRVGSTFPQSFFVWAALPAFALGWGLMGWRRWAWDRRVTSVAAVVATGLFGVSCVNSHYAYWPTVGDALGRPVHDEVRAGALTAVRGMKASTVTPNHGDVIPVDIPGTTSGFHARKGMVWLPPAYVTDRQPHLPVIIVLAGVPGDPTNMIRAGRASEVADTYAAAHHGVAPIMVFPDHNGGFLNDTECVDGPRGQVESYLLADVPHFIETHFNAALLGPQWGIIGFSEGGTCAVTLALRHPGDFGGFIDIGGDLRPNAATGPRQRALTVERLYGGDARQWATHDPLNLMHNPIPTSPLAIFAAGLEDRDGLANAQTLDAAARRDGLRTLKFFVPGGHTFMTVQRVLPHVVPALADQLLGTTAGRSPPTASATA